MGDDFAHTARDVHQHRRDRAAAAIDEDQRRRAGKSAQLGVARERRANDHAVDLLGHRMDEILFGCRILIAIGEEDRVAGLVGTNLHAAQDAGVERIGQIRNDDAEVSGLAGDKAAGGAIRMVRKLFRGGENTIARLGPQ